MVFGSVKPGAAVVGGALGALGGISGCAFANVPRMANATSERPILRIGFILGILARIQYLGVSIA